MAPLKLFSKLSIKWKIIFIIFSVCIPSTLVCLSAVSYYDISQTRQELRINFQITTNITGDHLSASLAFRDLENANKILSAFQHDKSIKQACLYDVEGKLFASFFGSELPEQSCQTAQDGSPDRSSNFEVFSSTIQEKHLQNLGTLFVYTHLERVSELMRTQMFFVFGCLLFVLVLISFPLANMIQKSISKPVNDLLETSRSIWTLPELKTVTTEKTDTSDEIILILEILTNIKSIAGSYFENIEATESVLVNYKNFLDTLDKRLKTKDEIYESISADFYQNNDIQMAEYVLGIQTVLNKETQRFIEWFYEAYNDGAHILRYEQKTSITDTEIESMVKNSFENLANCRVPIMISEAGLEWFITGYERAMCKVIDNISEYCKSLMLKGVKYQIFITLKSSNKKSLHFTLICASQKNDKNFNLEHLKVQESYLKIRHYNNLNNPHPNSVQIQQNNKKVEVIVNL